MLAIIPIPLPFTRYLLLPTQYQGPPFQREYFGEPGDHCPIKRYIGQNTKKCPACSKKWTFYPTLPLLQTHLIMQQVRGNQCWSVYWKVRSLIGKYDRQGTIRQSVSKWMYPVRVVPGKLSLCSRLQHGRISRKLFSLSTITMTALSCQNFITFWDIFYLLWVWMV